MNYVLNFLQLRFLLNLENSNLRAMNVHFNSDLDKVQRGMLRMNANYMV